MRDYIDGIYVSAGNDGAYISLISDGAEVGGSGVEIDKRNIPDQLEAFLNAAANLVDNDFGDYYLDTDAIEDNITLDGSISRYAEPYLFSALLLNGNGNDFDDACVAIQRAIVEG